MITEMQVVVTCVLVVVVAVVSWCAAAWWTAGRYEEEIRGLEDDLEARAAFGFRPEEIAHEAAAVIAADAVAFGEHAGQALAVVREGPAWPLPGQAAVLEFPEADQSLTAWTRAMGEELAAYVDSLIEESRQARYGLDG